MAKNLLQKIMGRYMARDPEMVSMLRDIARLAREMQRALQRLGGAVPAATGVCVWECRVAETALTTRSSQS